MKIEHWYQHQVESFLNRTTETFSSDGNHDIGILRQRYDKLSKQAMR